MLKYILLFMFLDVATLFRAIGKTWIADEKYFDAITGLRYVALSKQKA